MAFGTASIGSSVEDAIDESLVRSDAMLFEQSVDRLGCGRRSFLFLGNVVFDALSKLGIFFPKNLERLFQCRSQGLFSKAAFLCVLAVSLSI
jgi:hypothetical protein